MLRSALLVCLLLSACTVPAASPPIPPTSSASPSESPTPSASSTPLPVSSASPSPRALPQTKGPNLIANAGAELAGSSEYPEGWTPDYWGTQTTTLSWESTGSYSGNRYLSIETDSHSDGDAKWISKPQKLEKDAWYEYSEQYRADGRNRLIWACRTAAGQRVYRVVWQSHASSDWSPASFRFYNSGFQDCETSIMHVLDRKGYLHTDHHELVKVEPKPFAKAMVSVTFDDIYTSAVDLGASELEKRGWKGSFYVTSRYAREGKAPYADANKIQQLISKGHEIGSHAHTHPYLSQLQDIEARAELRSGYEYLKSLGQAPAGVAYPFGDFSDKVEAETKTIHAYARTSLVGLNDKTADPYRLRIMPVTSSTTTSELFAWIEDAERTSTWLILLFHDIQPGKAADAYVTPLTQYTQILDYLQRKKLMVVPVNEALKQL